MNCSKYFAACLAIALIAPVLHAQRPAVNAANNAVNAVEPDGTTPLHRAIYQDDLASTESLIRAGADVKAANRYGVTPLSLACINGNAKIIEMLLTAGVDANTTLPE